MEKTQKILKKFISLILTFAISFGSYVFPVFAALPEDNETPTIEEVVDAYGALKTKGQEVNNKIIEINATNPAPDSPKAIAVAEVKNYFAELNDVFGNTKSDPIEYETLKVITTKYNVITVIVDFKLSDLGITLTNETMKQQVLNDTYNMLQEYYYQLEIMIDYLEKSEIYTDAINLAGEKFDNVSQYIEILDELDITYDRDLYETYAKKLLELMVVDVTDEDIQQATKLSDDLDTYTDSITTILKTNLLQKYNDFKTVLDNTTLTGTDIDDMKLYVNNAITELNSENYNLIPLSWTYFGASNHYEYLQYQNNASNPTTDYIDSEINYINELLSSISELDITVEQIEAIITLTNNQLLNTWIYDVEELVSIIDADELSEKLISGELDYETLSSFIELYNNNSDIVYYIDEIKYNIGNTQNTNINKDELNTYLTEKINNGIFGNGQYMNELSSIENTSKTDEERLEILDLIDLIEYSIIELKGKLNPSDDSVSILTEKIAELREFYNKSCDNNLTSLTVNGIEMDVTEGTYKVYVGNDVTEIKVLFEQSSSNAKVEVLNATNLKVGTNEVIVLVTAENGEVRQYTIEVVRAEATPIVTTTETDDTIEAVVTPLTNNNVSNETIEEEVIEEEHKNTSDSAEKYDEEIEEKEGLSALTVLLIVIGIALVGYGVYKIFGEKEDRKIEKAFEQSKANKPTPKKNNKSKKRK